MKVILEREGGGDEWRLVRVNLRMNDGTHAELEIKSNLNEHKISKYSICSKLELVDMKVPSIFVIRLLLPPVGDGVE